MRRSIATAILGAAIGLLATTAPVGADQSERAEEVLATFEGATINLAEGWARPVPARPTALPHAAIAPRPT